MWNRQLFVPVVAWRHFSSAAGPSSAAVAATPSTQTIKVPMRIKRKPTDLLKALASTVKADPTGQSYMFVDDPIFTPTRPFEAQNFALSKELGRKSARYFAAQYPTLFMYDEDEPRLSVFRPVQKPRTETGDDEASLNDRIDRLWVRSAMTVYENAVARNHPISTQTSLKLLELLAFYNNDDPHDLPESSIEIFYRQNMAPSSRSTWSDDGLAMKIYNSLPEPKDPRATAAIICGMLKYFAVEKGYELWQLSRELGGDEGKLKDPRVYEVLIKYGVERLKAVNAERWQLVLDLFNAMAEDGVKPTLQIFNAAFDVLSKASRWKRTEEAAKQLMQEMLHLGIHPSLGTFYYILRIHNKRHNLGNILNAILTHLEKSPTKQTLVDEADGKFFVESIFVACETLHDRAMAMRVHGLLKTGDNYLFMTDHMDEMKYYRALITFMSLTEDTKTFYDRFYQRITPRYFIPDSRLIEAFLRNIETSGDYKYLANACSDMIMYGHIFRREVLWEFLSVALRVPASQLTPEMLEKMIQMAVEIYKKVESQYEWVEQLKMLDKKRGMIEKKPRPTPAEGEDSEEKTNAPQGAASQNSQRHDQGRQIRMEWTSDLLASLAVMCSRGGATKQAWTIFSKAVPLTEEELKIKKKQGISVSPVIGEVPENLALELLDAFVRKKWFDESYAALRVIARGKNQKIIKESADKIKRNVPTNKMQLARLQKYLDIWEGEEKEEKS